ncbi:S8 family serine peptidase [Sphingobium sp. EM0848]|uniref:S8 family serine peptidase n=1 Tax=Sphingobium sp. EM0848 TaxID=2743473 RepID=UPI00159CA421|nr:S8 family serine peptidase [Sphingobium sp. EM0848]
MMASAQMRGGPSRELPMSHIPSIEDRGRPDGVGRPADPGANGLARAEQAQSERLSHVQRDKAEALARQYPDDYELDRNGALAIRGEVLVIGLSDKALAAAQKTGFSVVSRDVVDGLDLPMAVLSRSGWPLTKMIDRLRDIAPDSMVEADHVFSMSGAAWPMGGSGAPDANPGRAAGWRVGMIDTGSTPLPSTGARIHMVQQGFAPGGIVPHDHGTAVASIIARPALDDQANGPSGTLFAADIFGSGRRGGTAELMVRALGWMARQQVPVVNISMVGPYNGVVAAAIAVLVKRGTLIVAPVGNDGPSARLLYPASLKGVIAVTGVDTKGQLLPEASQVSRVDFAGPAVTAVRGISGRTVEMRGTSFASPVIAHHLAELLSAPDPRGARQAVQKLAGAAWKPKKGKSGLGSGIIGLAPMTSR